VISGARKGRGFGSPAGPGCICTVAAGPGFW